MFSKSIGVYGKTIVFAVMIVAGGSSIVFKARTIPLPVK